MEILEKISKMREYLDYIEDHALNVKQAWCEIKEKCMCHEVICSWATRIEKEIMNHDVSKLSSIEFVQYREKFYPTDLEECDETESDAFDKAWENHKKHNPHHWENWTKNNAYWEVNLVHMIADWIAMSYVFGGTAKTYYEKNKYEIDIPNHAEKIMYELFYDLGYM